MQASYRRWTPIYDQLLESSIWGEPFKVRVMWITILLLAARPGRKGVVDVPLDTLAATAKMSVKDAREAITILSSPDPESRSVESEGRRIELLDSHRTWGWRIINWDKYEKDRATAQSAIRMAKSRAAHAAEGGRGGQAA